MNIFLVVIRRTRAFTLEKGVGIFLATLFGIIFGILIFIWWIIGTVNYNFLLFCRENRIDSFRFGGLN